MLTCIIVQLSEMYLLTGPYRYKAEGGSRTPCALSARQVSADCEAVDVIPCEQIH